MATGTTKTTTSSASTGAPTTGETSTDNVDQNDAASANVEGVSGNEPEAPPAKRTIATYLPGKGVPAITRSISKKDAKQYMEVELAEDLEWSKTNNHRVDVSSVPEVFLEMLKTDPDFKISSE